MGWFMKVKCIANTNSVLPNKLLELQPSLKKYLSFPLKINKEYLVYTLEIQHGYAWYFICDEERNCNSPCPFWNPHPAVLFEITDGRLSQYWRYNNYIDNDPSYNKIIFAIQEWAINPVVFYTKFVDRQKNEVEIFRKYKDLMDREYPNASIKDAALQIERDWLMCPKCDEAWESKSILALVKCPKCFSLLNNPNYK